MPRKNEIGTDGFYCRDGAEAGFVRGGVEIGAGFVPEVGSIRGVGKFVVERDGFVPVERGGVAEGDGLGEGVGVGHGFSRDSHSCHLAESMPPNSFQSAWQRCDQ